MTRLSFEFIFYNDCAGIGLLQRRDTTSRQCVTLLSHFPLSKKEEQVPPHEPGKNSHSTLFYVIPVPRCGGLVESGWNQKILRSSKVLFPTEIPNSFRSQEGMQNQKRCRKENVIGGNLMLNVAVSGHSKGVTSDVFWFLPIVYFEIIFFRPWWNVCDSQSSSDWVRIGYCR